MTNYEVELPHRWGRNYFRKLGIAREYSRKYPKSKIYSLKTGKRIKKKIKKK